MTHKWSITGGYFIPDIATRSFVQRMGDSIVTELEDVALAEAIITDHMQRTRVEKTRADYRIENFGDEIRIDAFSGHRYRCLINLQYEGQS